MQRATTSPQAQRTRQGGGGRSDLPGAIDRDGLEAFLFDLDGVITDTADVHARAWKRAFDEYLAERNGGSNGNYIPFDLDADYKKYVDGKPRDEGVASFLESRAICLPRGQDDDLPDQETICGLGNRKNRYYRESIESEGVRVYGGAVDLVRQLKARGLKVAVVSSSKNCSAILLAAGIADLFDGQVDGVVACDLHLRGKPAGDIFLEAARRLGVQPEKAAVVEDALSGVRAGRAGGFGLVVGVDRSGDGKALEGGGADLIVHDLSVLDLGETSDLPDPPSALSRLTEIVGRVRDKQIALFFDYDGTLTPIVERPDLAKLSGAMRDTLERLSRLAPVTGIISGRGRADLQGLVGLPSLVYAGSHGFDIAGPQGLEIEHEEGHELIPAVSAAVKALSDSLADVPGVLVEDKLYCLAVHYRLVPEERVSEVERGFDAVADRFPALRKTLGKKVFELRPALPWDKGRAVLWILQALGLDQPEIVPFYFGDDVTDYDAFRALRGKGVSILVSETPEATPALYRLKDPDEVRAFLEQLCTRLGRQAP